MSKAAQYGPFNLLIVDTSAAYFRGDDENSNATARRPCADAALIRQYSRAFLPISASQDYCGLKTSTSIIYCRAVVVHSSMKWMAT